VWPQSFDCFDEGKRLVRYRRARPRDAGRVAGPPPSDKPGRRAEQAGALAALAGATGEPAGSADTLRRVFATVQNALYAARHPLPAAVADEIGEELDRSGEPSWERLGTIWARHGRARLGARSSDVPPETHHTEEVSS
jgi:hypothetical protein